MISMRYPPSKTVKETMSSQVNLMNALAPRVYIAMILAKLSRDGLSNVRLSVWSCSVSYLGAGLMSCSLTRDSLPMTRARRRPVCEESCNGFDDD